MRHAFSYAVDMTYLDLDELDVVFEGRWFWSTRRMAWSRFRRSDYVGDPKKPLKEAVCDVIAKRLGFRPTGRVGMLTTLRRLGHSFNPVTFYWAFDSDGDTPVAFLAEITNTPWNERFVYAFRWSDGEAVGGSRRFRFPKEFHVSPFFPMNLSYDWTIGAPGERVVIHMEDWNDNAKIFDADLMATRQPITGRSLAASLIRSPMTSMMVLGAIYWQALRLKWRGVPFHPNPSAMAREGSSGL